MKLLRYGPDGFEKPGMLDKLHHIRDLSGIVANIDWDAISPQGLKKLAKLQVESLPLVRGQPRLGVPYIGIGKFIGVGLNYIDHAKETGAPIPSEPVIFMKATTSICGPYDRLIIPKGSKMTDWEVEIGVVIGSKAQYVPEEKALDYIAGYCGVNDVSERHYQKERGGLWDKGKGCDTFGPIGPWLVTKDEIPNPQNIEMWLEVNGNRYQHGNTKNMIFGCAYLVSYVSQFMTLMPGDIITTGTPAGVGMGMNPPRYLQPNDILVSNVQGLGEQKHRTEAWSG